MIGYYTYISSGVIIDKVQWTEPYESATRFKGRKMTTGAFPVYYIDGSTRYLLGVVASDILLDEL